MSEYKLFVQRIGYISITNVVLALSAIILVPILTKNIPIDDYGVYVQITITVSLLPNLIMLGLPYTMVRFLAAHESRERIQEVFYTLFFTIMSLNVLILILLLLLSGFISTTLLNNNLLLAKIMALIVFFASINVFLMNYFRTFQQIKTYSIFSITQTFVNILLTGYFIFSGYGVLGAVISLLISQFFITLLILPIILRQIGFKIPKFENLREYLSFGLPTVPGNFSKWIVDSSDRYIITLILGIAYVGYYSPGYNVGWMIVFIAQPLATLLPPALSKFYDQNKLKQVNVITEYSLKYYLILAIPALFGAIILSKPILNLLSTQQIASQGYLITPFSALSAVFFGLFLITSTLLILKMETKLLGKIWLFAAGLNLPITIILVQYIGILGAAIATLIVYLIASVYVTHKSIKIFKIKINVSYLPKIILSSLIMSAGLLIINPDSVLKLILAMILGIIIYLTSLYLIKTIKKDELEFFKKILLNN